MASQHPAKVYPGNGVVGSSPTSSAEENLSHFRDKFYSGE